MIRVGIRRQLAERIASIQSASLAEAYERKAAFVEALRSRPIAIDTATANKQHYEVGTGVLAACLGPRMKYSSCLYPKGKETLAEAEVEMLQSYVEKAGLKDGMEILDLGYVLLFHYTPHPHPLPPAPVGTYGTCRLTVSVVSQLWMGFWSTLLRRGLTQSEDHGVFQL